MPQSFDEAFPGGFEECVSTLGQEPSIDDPEALCGWLQEHGFDAIENANPDSILAGLEVEFVSVVDQPAQDSEWLMAKSEDADPSDFQPGGDDRIREAGVLFKQDGPGDADEPDRKVWAAVLKPGEADAHGDLVPEPEIEAAAHTYLKEFRKVDSDHDLLDGEGEPIESYIVRDGPDEFETPDGTTKSYPEGTWIMGVELSDEAWKRVENGELTGFSIYGGAAKLNPDALLTEEQAKAIMDARERAEKQVPDAFLDAFNAYLEDHGGSPGEVTLSDFLMWALDDGESVEVGGETVEGGDGPTETDDEDGSSEESSGDDEDEEGDDDVAEQARKTLAVAKSMGNENEPDDDGDVTELLGEIRDTVKSTNEQVETHSERLDDLRNDLDETRKEVGLVEGEESETEEAEESEASGEGEEDTEKSEAVTRDELEAFGESLASTLADELSKDAESGEESEEEEVVRKGDTSPTDEETVEKNSGDSGPTVDLSTGGITDAGKVN